MVMEDEGEGRGVWRKQIKIFQEEDGRFVISHLSDESKGIFVHLHHHLQLTEPRHQIIDVAVIKWGEGRKFKWLNFAWAKCQD